MVNGYSFLDSMINSRFSKVEERRKNHLETADKHQNNYLNFKSNLKSILSSVEQNPAYKHYATEFSEERLTPGQILNKTLKAYIQHVGWHWSDRFWKTESALALNTMGWVKAAFHSVVTPKR